MFEEKEQGSCFVILRSEDRGKGKVSKTEKHEKWSEEGQTWQSWSRSRNPAWLMTEGMSIGGESAVSAHSSNGRQ